ncbi:MAG: TonB-dependent receptor [Bacteroidia bacterium]|jgi:outer membrane receptor protein involved in Fe transport|nr:TonB-dependent receptor [Bacteroidia bacterium]
MRKYFALLLLFNSVAAQAQNIRGNVSFEKDKSPVQFATVALLQLPDSAMITGVITLTDGGYLLEKIKPGNYFIRASFVGYRSSGKEVTVKEGDREILVDTIYLAEITTALTEVTVVGERLKGKEMVDRTVYSIPEVIAKSSSNGYDLLKKIPQVNVDFQNNITLNGSSNFIIQVDGRQRDREFLARLLPSDIQTIEIISNPSGKYEGNIDGVINIILKKEARHGINGNVALSIKPFNKLTSQATGSIDYAIGKITFYVTAMYITQSLNISNTNENRFTKIDSTISTSGNGGIKVSLSSVNSGFDYYMNDRNNLSFNVSYKPISQDVELPNSTILYKSNVPLNTISSLSSNNLKSNETAFSLFYKRTFKKPIEEFTAEASYYMFKSVAGNDFTNNRHPYNSDVILDTVSRLEDDLNKRNYFSTKLDYVYPVGMNTKIEAGYQFYYQQMGYDFIIDNQADTNLFEYAELRNSVYGGVTLNLKKLGFQAMLRVENSHIMADSVTRPDYSCFLPSANIQYKFSASHNLKLTYNRRINRPGIYSMNPNLKIGQSYDITQGNPDLRPDYRDRLQLTYTWNFGSNYFSPYVYDEFFSDKVSSRFSIIQSPVNGSLTTLSKPFNILSGSEYGGGINAMLWYVNINARIYNGHYSEYTEGSFSIPARDYFSYAITSYAFVNFDKKKKTTAFIYLSYNGVNINAQSKTYSIPLYGLGGQWQIKDHTIGIFWLLPFSKDIRFSRTETETIAYTSKNITGINMANFIMFSYSYKFNKGRNVKKLDHKVEVESDSKSQTIGR